MATTIFLDEFGGTGSLTAHSPDISQAPSTWIHPAVTTFIDFDLDGGGEAVTSDPFGGTASNVHIPSIEYATPYGFEFEAELRVEQSVHPLALAQASLLDGAGANIAKLVLDDNGTSIDAKCRVGASDFAAVPVSFGLHTLSVTAGLESATFYVDGNPEQTISVSPDASIARIQIFVETDNTGPAADWSVSRVQLSASAAPVNAAFWQNFVGTFEIP